MTDRRVLLAFAVLIAAAFTPLQKVVAQATGSAYSGISQIFAGDSNVVISGSANAPTIDLASTLVESSYGLTTPSGYALQPVTGTGIPSNSVGVTNGPTTASMGANVTIGPQTAAGTVGPSQDLCFAYQATTTTQSTACMYAQTGNLAFASTLAFSGGNGMTMNSRPITVGNSFISAERYDGSSTGTTCGKYSAPLASTANIAGCNHFFGVFNAATPAQFVVNYTAFSLAPSMTCLSDSTGTVPQISRLATNASSTTIQSSVASDATEFECTLVGGD